MATGIFGIGITGLQAAQAGLVTAGHNIANANTPGFSRQQVVQANAQPQSSGLGYIGTGTQVVTVRRMFSEFLNLEMLNAGTQSAELDTYYAQMRQIDNLLADPTAGLSPALQDFFSAVQDVAAFPNVSSSRQALIAAATALQSRLRTLDGRLTELRDGVNQDLATTSEAVTTYARQIADLNQRIIVARNAAGGQPPNDLMDQRDQMVAELNQLVRVSVIVQDDGAYNVFIGSGQPLVAGTLAFGVEAMRDPLNPTAMTLGYRSPAGLTALPEASISGGRLGGLLAFRSQSLDPAQNALGRVAIALAQTFNAQHALGQDLHGNLGTDFFAVGDPQVTHPTSNGGTAQISASFAADAASALTTSNYRLTYDGVNYTLLRLSDHTQQTFATLPQTVDGFTLTLDSGTPAIGDSFLIRPTAAGASTLDVLVTDPARIAAAAPIRTGQGAGNIGTGVVSAGTVDSLDPNLQQPVTITFTGPNTFNVTGAGTGNPTGLTYVPGQDISFNGWTLQITGSPVAGDTFSVGPNTGGTGDSRNALRLAGLQTEKLMMGGTASYQTAYASLVSEVASKTRELEVTSAAQATIHQQARTARESFSGVNLDEEAANLIRYQQAYQAAGKVLAIASTLFDTLLEIGR